MSLEWLGGSTDVRIPFYQPGIQTIYNRLSLPRQQAALDFAEYLYDREQVALLEAVEDGPGLAYSAADAPAAVAIPPGADLVWKAYDQSMQPLLKMGDVIFARSQGGAEDGGIVLIEWRGSHLCRRASLRGRPEFHPLNSRYPVIDAAEALVVGRVLST